MKHIRLFENFDQLPSGSGVMFDWMCFDSEINNPINNSVPTEIGLDEVMEYCNSNPDIGKVGLFIAHKKNSGGGFNRYIITSTSPIRIDFSTFDSDYKKVNEINDIDPVKHKLDDLDKGSSMLGRFGLFDGE
jgi:hypothetical protein